MLDNISQTLVTLPVIVIVTRYHSWRKHLFTKFDQRNNQSESDWLSEPGEWEEVTHVRAATPRSQEILIYYCLAHISPLSIQCARQTFCHPSNISHVGHCTNNTILLSTNPISIHLAALGVPLVSCGKSALFQTFLFCQLPQKICLCTFLVGFDRTVVQWPSPSR